ncbi:transcriptional regulator, LuxR family [Xylanimonas cellulosilytica DSM 15894]|uniref:Transcriptional regulator, LuxR family n=1 Tax=Xylanimonas cellulosilytica (strain DSM 15894 / JCM 12276 / CECT 5975 / KCTC 9989 / LMG 20990 / NBRC 107835 / XIL07) TaxID=446471 RepID=D1BRL1_XYLCX|nr:transcriptional regulator, LuxR family [Xylanimonas cellulosilytica DSM 15894]
MAREAEVATFRRALARAGEGSPGVLLVGGDAGVGKTRLITHLAQVAQQAGARVVVAHCVDLGEVGIPYLPFSEALSQLSGSALVDQTIRERPALARLLDPGVAPAVQSDDVAERLQLLDGLRCALAAAGSADEPLVLVLEDLHWAEPSTRDVLRFLVARLRSEHLLVLGTFRTDDLDRRHPLRPVLAELYRQPTVERVDLFPFTEPELRRFTTALAESPLPDAEFDQVLRRSEGNAFFAEELLGAGGPSAGLPWSLTDVLHARLQRLDPAVHELARIASVAGRLVREDLLRATAARTRTFEDPAALDAALRDAVAHQVFEVEGSKLAFRHALLAEALYLDLLPGEQSRLHRTYLSALTDDPSLGKAAQRAHHALHGHDLPTALAASHEAADRAAGVLAPDEELRHREQVLSLWDSVPDAETLVGVDKAEVALAASEAASRAGLFSRAEQLARRAVEALEDDKDRQAAARDLLARHLLDQDFVDEAYEQAELAVARLSAQGPSPALAWATARRARALLNLDRDDDAAAAAAQAVEVAFAVGAPGAEADALTTLAVLDAADPDTSASLLETARARAADAGELLAELRTTQNLSTTYFYAGDLAKADVVLAEGIARAESTGLSWSAGGQQLHVLDELFRYVRGDLTARPAPPGMPTSAVPLMTAVQLYAAVARGDVDAVARGKGLRDAWDVDGQVALYAGGTLADALTWAGRYDDAVAAAVELAEHLGRVWSEYFLGRIWISALALAALASAAELVPAGSSADSLSAARAKLLEVGDALAEVAHTTAVRGRPRGGKLGPEGRAWLLRVDAELARLRAAASGAPADPARWEATVREFGFGYRYEEARSRFRWAQALHAADDVEAATREAVTALAEADVMGAAPLAGAVREWARRARVALPGTPRRHESVASLTDREEEVLTLVAEGLSNRQIGERLYISTKTVSVHVSNVLAKLGVSGRTEAVDVAHRKGLLEV